MILNRRHLLIAVSAVPLGLSGCAGQTPSQILTDIANIGTALGNALAKVPADVVAPTVVTQLRVIDSDIVAAVTKVRSGALPSGTALQETLGWIDEAITIAAGVPIPPGLPAQLAATWTAVSMVLSAAQVVLPALAASVGVPLPAAMARTGPTAAYRATSPRFPDADQARAYLARAAGATTRR